VEPQEGKDEPLAAVNPLLPSLCAVKHWSKILSMSARDTTAIAPLMGEDENSIIRLTTELNDGTKKGSSLA
jgi:hypothetical protein